MQHPSRAITPAIMRADSESRTTLAVMRKANRGHRAMPGEDEKKRFSYERGWKWCEIAIGIPWKGGAGG